MPLRVTLIGSLPPEKGISPYCLSLASSLAARPDLDVDMLTFRSLYPARLYPGGSPSVAGEQYASIPGARTRRMLSWWDPLSWLRAGLSLRGDVVHAQWWSYPLAPMYMTILGVARLRGKRVGVTVHNSEPHEGGMLRRLCNRIVLPFAHQLIVHTCDQADTLGRAREANPGRVVIVPMGVGAPESISHAERVASRAALGVSADSPLVLFLGNIRPYKGLPTLLDAFKMVVAEMPDATLLVAGQPWGPPASVLSLIDDAGLRERVVTRLEYVSAADMRAHYAAADLVVYPYTRFDAQSAAACYALHYGKPIIVTRTGGLPDLVADERAVVPANDPDSLASAIIAVLGDRSFSDALAVQSRNIALALSWDEIATRTVQVYSRTNVEEDVAPFRHQETVR